MAKATARHILVNSEEKCEALKAEIEGGRDFAEVAREHSTCPSGARGGDHHLSHVVGLEVMLHHDVHCGCQWRVG